MTSRDPTGLQVPGSLAAPWLRTANGSHGKGKETTAAHEDAPGPSSTAVMSHSRAKAPQRMPSLYSNASIAATQDHSQGATTYDYDVNASLRRQQQRRRRQANDAHASISTQASGLSHTPSVTSFVAQGEFIRAPSIAASSVRHAPRHGAAHGEGDKAVNEARQEEDAHDMLQRVRRDSVASRYSTASVPRKRGGVGGSGERGREQTAATLSDTLEQIIANSVSYRTVAPMRSRYGTFKGPEGEECGQGGLTPSTSQRTMPLSGSSKSLAAMYKGAPPRQAQMAADGLPASASSRSGWAGTFSGAQRAVSLWAFGGPQPAPTMGTPLRTSQATLALPSGNAVAHGLPAYRTRADGQDTLRDLRSLLATGKAPARREATASRPLYDSTLKATNTFLQVPSSQKAPLRKSKGRVALQSLFVEHDDASPSETAMGNDKGSKSSPTGSQRSAHENGAAKEPIPSRRAFAAIDPTSHEPSTHIRGHDSHDGSEASRPRLSRHTTRSSGNVSLSSATAPSVKSPTLPPSSPAPSASSGAMPALDPALARAEEKSGLNKKSQCTTCGKRVLNAPMTRSGDVFCGRECRMAKKAMRQSGREAIVPAQPLQQLHPVVAASTT